MLRTMLSLAMGFMVASALTAPLQAQSGPNPAEKAQSAGDDPFADDAAPPVQPKAAVPGERTKPTADDDPFGDDPVPQVKVVDAKPKAKSNADVGKEDPLDASLRSPPKNLALSKPAVPVRRAATSKPASEKPPAAKPHAKVVAQQPLRVGEKAILKAMEMPATLDFVETPLQDVVAYLQDAYHIAIKLDTNALKEAGVDSSAQVTCSLSGVPLRSALRIILSDLQLEWVIWSDIVLITSPTKAESDEFMSTKFYDVSDLIVETRDKPYRGNGLPTADDGGPSPQFTVGGMGSGCFGGVGFGSIGTKPTGGTGGAGSVAAGGGGMFSLPPETAVPATSSSPASVASRDSIGRGAAVSRAVGNAGGGAGVCGTAMAMAGGGMVRSNNNDDVTSLIDLLTSTVASKTWVDNGGTGSISHHGNVLCVSQSFKVQCEVKLFLADLRATRRAAPTIVVDLQWLWLDRTQYEQLSGGEKAAGGGRTRLAVDAKALDSLARNAPGFRGRIACSNGQLVHLASGDRRAVIVSTIPVIGSGVGYSPVVQVPNAGVIVELRPTVVPGSGTAIVDVQSTVTRWGKPQPTAHVGAAWPASQITEGSNKDIVRQETSVDPAGSGSCPVQRPVMPAQQLATTVRVPLGKPVVLGGMTFAPAESAGVNRVTDDPIQLYLIATTSAASDVSP